MSSYFKMYISAAIILIVAAGCGNVNSTANTNTPAPPQTLLLATNTSSSPTATPSPMATNIVAPTTLPFLAAPFLEPGTTLVAQTYGDDLNVDGFPGDRKWKKLPSDHPAEVQIVV